MAYSLVINMLKKIRIFNSDETNSTRASLEINHASSDTGQRDRRSRRAVSIRFLVGGWRADGVALGPSSVALLFGRLLPAFATRNHKRVRVADFNALQTVAVVASFFKQVCPHVVQEAVCMFVSNPAVVPAAGPHVVLDFRPCVGFVGCRNTGKFALLPYRRLFGLHHLNFGYFLRRSLGRGEGGQGRQGACLIILLLFNSDFEPQRFHLTVLLRLLHHFGRQNFRLEQGAGLRLGGLCHGLNVPDWVGGIKTNVRFAKPAILLGRHLLVARNNPHLEKNTEVTVVNGLGLHIVL